ncbi:peptidoglycan bridge formation glycyltransferase FemA/FemB family protein, partial [Patescibacteria group bacterium]|nr:peptidoglycan bridge formation glycyltransferase FemA/FemB family protein [Patescibacteria group bacterium]
WGEFREKMGIDVVRLIVEEKNRISQCWQLMFHPIPFTSFTIGYFPKGPLPDQFMINELTKIGKQKKALFIQLEPNVDSKTVRQEDNKNNSNILPSYRLPVSSSLHPSHHPLFTKYTFVLDLTKSEDELLKSMHPKTRYNIRVAQKHGVVVKEDNSDKAFEEYLRLCRETTKRQGFYAHNEEYHQNMWNIMSKAGLAKLWTASYQGKVVVAWIIFVWKDTIYYPYGASCRENREVMAPNLLLWEIAKWGKKNGYKKFDLWGALGPNPEPHDPWYGFHRFKEGYHPDLVEYVGSYDLVINPILYKLYCIGNTVRWNILKLKMNLKF